MTYRASELLLMLVAAQPDAALSPIQVDQWFAQLYKAGYLEKGAEMKWILTQKAREHLSRVHATAATC